MEELGLERRLRRRDGRTSALPSRIPRRHIPPLCSYVTSIRVGAVGGGRRLRVGPSGEVAHHRAYLGEGLLQSSAFAGPLFRLLRLLGLFLRARRCRGE